MNFQLVKKRRIIFQKNLLKLQCFGKVFKLLMIFFILVVLFIRKNFSYT